MASQLIVRMENVSANETYCPWPERHFQYVWESTGFKYTEYILHPIWLFICTVGNILTIMLLGRMHTFQTTFITAIAYFDLLTMWGWIVLSLQVYVGYSSAGDDLLPSRAYFNITSVPTRAVLVTSEFLGNVGSGCSDWVLALFSVARLLYAMDPFRPRAVCTAKARAAVLCLIPPAVMCSIFPLIEFAYTHDYGLKPPPDWIREWKQVWYMGMTISGLVTFAVILLANVFAAVMLRRHSGFPHENANQPLPAVSSHKFVLRVKRRHGLLTVRALDNDVTVCITMRLLTASVILYFVTTIPYMSWYLLTKLERQCRIHISDHQYAVLVAFFLQFSYMKYSLNFILYCGMSRTFLKHFLATVASFWRNLAGRWTISRCAARLDGSPNEDTARTNRRDTDVTFLSIHRDSVHKSETSTDETGHL
ncbi:uncharacterized protein LOC129598876 [Paramacrobiotus metropolitanus]|uniref:uncharacterized protein LOC129598876 n=1 Tax=Paramacrobiotus metropolitanus TaxID=2943436 RepID=UPI0024459C15|nr:uncharacterized protein LOC129598876 [Paramacrobiotus metropolitanus]